MVAPSKIITKFENLKPYLGELGKRVNDTLRRYCDEKEFAFISRYKTLESVIEKLETGRFKTWSEIDDLYACTIIIPTQEFEGGAIAFCKNTFEALIIRGKEKALKPPESFRFDVRRIICRLKPPFPEAASDPLYHILFEVQIRTALEHAWCVATHDLVYKTNVIDWKKIRLAAQIKASLEQFDTVFMAFDDISEKIIEHKWPEIKAYTRIISFFNGLFESSKLSAEIRPRDLSRFAKNFYSILISSGKSKHLSGALKTVEKELDYLKKQGIAGPVCISLLQFVLGSLCKWGFLDSDLKDFYCLVPDELTSLYPDTRIIKIRCDLDN